MPGALLEIDFAGGEQPPDDWAGMRPMITGSLMKCLITDGVAFEEKEAASDWKPSGGASTRIESVIDSWIRAEKYPWSKAKDLHSKKVRWVLDCEEKVIILAEPEGS